MSTIKNDSAFVGQTGAYSFEHGLTKREYFAAMALNGMLSDLNSFSEDYAKNAVEYADRLIEALNERSI